MCPAMTDAETIGRVVKGVDAPVNVVMGLAGSSMSANELEDLSVKRVRIGVSLARATFGLIRGAAAEICVHGYLQQCERAGARCRSLPVLREPTESGGAGIRAKRAVSRAERESRLGADTLPRSAGYLECRSSRSLLAKTNAAPSISVPQIRLIEPEGPCPEPRCSDSRERPPGEKDDAVYDQVRATEDCTLREGRGGGINELRNEGREEHDRERVRARGDEALAEELRRRSGARGCGLGCPRAREDQPKADPGEIRNAEPLDGLEHRRRGRR